MERDYCEAFHKEKKKGQRWRELKQEKKKECLKENDDVTTGERKRWCGKKENVCLYNVRYVMYNSRYTGRSSAILFAHEYTHTLREMGMRQK